MYKKLTRDDEAVAKNAVKEELLHNPELLWKLSENEKFDDFVHDKTEEKLLKQQFGMEKERLWEKLAPYSEEIITRTRILNISITFFGQGGRIRYWNTVADILNEDAIF